MSIIKEAPVQTKTGHKITFKVFEKSPDPNDQNMNLGWVVHKIIAYVNGEEAGYIKISYVPKENVSKFYPTVFEYAANLGGRYQLKDYSNKSIIEQIIALDKYPYQFSSKEEQENLKNLSTNELIKLKSRSEKEYIQEYNLQQQYDNFIDFYVDKPLVDYIMVYDAFKRSRIGENLYVVTSKYLAKKGLKLYASSLQSPEAKASWNNLGNKYSNKISNEIPLNKKYQQRTTFSHVKENIKLIINNIVNEEIKFYLF